MSSLLMSSWSKEVTWGQAQSYCERKLCEGKDTERPGLLGVVTVRISQTSLSG